MSLRLHNSLSDQKEDFVPLREGRVTLYVCGPTVYNDSHLGHAKTYVSFDVILRYLKYRGFNTFYVQNITDVGHLMGDADEGEDKMLKRARELELEPMAVAETYTTRHFQAMDRMGVIRPDICPRATGHIPEQLEAIEKMIEAGLAYEVNGSVYFDVSKDPEYGKLSNRSFEEMQEGARVEVRQEKRNPQDFALWKKAEAGHLMRWRDSYSGWGYPGWHTECAVMSTRYLGDSFDIHGGGMELKFPHHDCEISQARGLGKPFANYWMHNNMLTIDGQKMSKSTGNFVTLIDAFEQHDPLAVRTLRERKPADQKPLGTWFQEIRQRFESAMDDDFSTPQAFAALFDLNREVNSMLASEDPNPEAMVDAESLFSVLGGEVLGIIPEKIESGESDQRLNDVMQVMIDLRNQFREEKNFQGADMIRDRLAEAGIQLKDSREGTNWE